MKKLTIKELEIQKALGTVPDEYKLAFVRGREPELGRKRTVRCKCCRKQIPIDEKAIKAVLNTYLKGWICLDCQYVSPLVLARDFNADLLSEFNNQGIFFNPRAWWIRNYIADNARSIVVKRQRTCKFCGHTITKGQLCLEVKSQCNVGTFTLCPECTYLSWATILRKYQK